MEIHEGKELYEFIYGSKTLIKYLNDVLSAHFRTASKKLF